MGTARSEEELADLAETRAEIDFDPDIYGILTSYIAKHRHAVRPLPTPRCAEGVSPADEAYYSEA